MLLSYNADILPKVRFCGRVRYKEPWIHFERTTNEYIMYVIRDGEMFLEEDNEKYHLQSGDCIILEPGLRHVGFKAAPCDYYYVHFTHEELMRKCDEDRAMEELTAKRRITLISYNLDVDPPTDSITYVPKNYHFHDQEYRAELNSMVEGYNTREEHYRSRTSTFFHLFLLRIAHSNLLEYNSLNRRKIRRSEIIAEEIVKYINLNYNQKLTSADIEERFEVNFDYINRIVAEITGSTIFAYLNDTRIKAAKQLIGTTNLPFSRIAELVGIEDRYYFSKLFRRITGMTASKYYEMTRNDSYEGEQR